MTKLGNLKPKEVVMLSSKWVLLDLGLLQAIILYGFR